MTRTKRVKFKKTVTYMLPYNIRITFVKGDVYTAVNSFKINGVDVTLIHRSMSAGIVVMSEDLEEVNEQN